MLKFLSFKLVIPITIITFVCLLPSSLQVESVRRKQGKTKISSNEIIAVDDRSNLVQVQICETELCAKQSDRLRTMAKLNLNPCEDFYKFACGGYGGSIMNLAYDIVRSRLNDIFREVDESVVISDSGSSGTSSMKRLSSLYRSCMEREPGYKPLVEILRKLGGFPLLANLTGWSSDDIGYDDKTTWFDLLLRLSSQGLDHNHLFSLTVGTYDFDNSLMMIKLGDLVFQEPDIEFVNNHLTTISEIDRDGFDRGDAIHQLISVKRFQQSLFNLSRSDQTKIEPKTMTIDELRQLAPRTDWLKFLQYIFEKKSIRLEEKIIVTNGYFISQVDELLTRIDIKTLRNFVFLNIINDFKPELILADATKTGNEVRTECQQKVAIELGFDLSSEYVRRYMDANLRKSVQSISRYIQREMKFSLEHSIDWISSQEMRTRAKRKLDNMLVQIAYTNELMNQTKLNQMFNNILKFDPQDDYLTNLLRLTTARRLYEAATINKPYRSLAWQSFARAYQVNANYQPNQNSISLFAGLLTEAHYYPSRPQYMNFATIGSTLGHELGHAFDPDCVNRDQCGQLKPQEIWWDEQTAKEYSQRANCIREKFDGLKLPNVTDSSDAAAKRFRLNGTQTLNENLADLMGYKLAYDAYGRYVGDGNESESEPRLPKLEQFNERQLFWLTLANKFCDYDSPERLASRYWKNRHSPGYFRVNIPLQNMDEFSRDFQCPVGSPMNPNDQCRLW